MQALPKSESPALYGASFSATIYNTIRKDIVAGVYQAGASIPQEALAKRFEASRAPIREALCRLEAEGLIVLRPRRGYIVKELDASEIAEIFEMRAVMEEHAAFAATRARSAADIAEVRALQLDMERMSPVAPEAVSDWVSINRDFHQRLFESSGRRHLCHAIGLYRDRVDSYIRLEIGLTGRLGEIEADHDHRLIVDAFEAGDAELAGRLSKEHCLHTAERLLAALKDRQ